MWLYKAGISNAEIEALGFYWNPRMQRVVLPVRNELGEVVYWQARTLDKTNPRKVLNPRADKSRLVFRAGNGPSIALTEDILSSVKIGGCGIEAWALMGTRLSPYIASRLVEYGKPVVIALDPDAAGRCTAAHIRKELSAYGCIVKGLVFTKDPKLIERDVIRAELDRLGIARNVRV